MEINIEIQKEIYRYSIQRAIEKKIKIERYREKNRNIEIQERNIEIKERNIEINKIIKKLKKIKIQWQV